MMLEPSVDARLTLRAGTPRPSLRSLCSTALRYDDHELAAFAGRLNDGLSHPRPAGELAGIVRSVMRYRAQWRAHGHQQVFLFRQSRRGRRGGHVSGQSRRRAVAVRATLREKRDRMRRTVDGRPLSAARLAWTASGRRHLPA